jgi:hypothetical protein
MANIARVSRREIHAQRPFDVGMTASVPSYQAVDPLGNKEWVCDILMPPATGGGGGLLRNVVIAPTAKHLIGDIRLPVRLERSQQGKYTVVGRAKVVPAGMQMPDGVITNPNYHETKVNLADLGLLFIPDLDFEIEPWGEGSFGGEGRVYEAKTATDAWGHQVMGEGAETPAHLGFEPERTTTTRHTIIQLKPWGGIPEENFIYGVDQYAGNYLKTVELTE